MQLFYNILLKGLFVYIEKKKYIWISLQFTDINNYICFLYYSMTLFSITYN